ncbi:MAG TPA: M15 family metallopeptidase [Dermatophilaceae bacterium]|nr:M15 family metallopeptidase [Dermatophilaceae bacterium]
MTAIGTGRRTPLTARCRPLVLLIAIGVALAAGLPHASAPAAAAAAAAAGFEQPSDPAELTPAEVARQVAAGQQLQAQLTSTSAAVVAATANLSALADRANLFLQRLAEADAAQQAARAAQATARAQSRRLAADLAGRQAEIGRWARDSYVSGDGRLQELAAFASVLTNPDPAKGADLVGLLQYLADERALRFAALTTTANRQVAAERDAAAAAVQAAAAARDAKAARAVLLPVVDQQRSALARLRDAERSELSTLTEALRRSQAGRDPALTAALSAAAVPVVGTCRADNAAYPNGLLPASALCPLYQAPGEYLREQPARNFNALSRAYERDTGRPLCVTDGYRSYAEQVAVYAARPQLAARPGTSQHGLGLAVDLCGGVQSFGEAAYLWMKRYAPLYGWFHPSWAEPVGSKPEPWHWEFAG